MQKQLIGGKEYAYKQQVKHIDRNSICIMDGPMSRFSTS